MSEPFIPYTINPISYPPSSPYPPIVLPFVISSSYDISTGVKNVVLNIQVFDTSSPLGIYQGSNSYDGNSIIPGMWISSSVYGNAWLIKTINSKSSTTVDCDVEDIELFNESLSPSTPTLGVNEPGFIFELSEDGMPALTNADIRNLLNINNWEQFLSDLNARFTSRNVYKSYFRVYQPSHNLQVGNFLYIDPDNSQYKIATGATQFNYYIIGNVTSIGFPTSDWFTYRPRGKYLTPDKINFPYASPLTGSVGSLYYIQENGSISTYKPFSNSSPVYVQVSTGATGGAGILIDSFSASSSTVISSTGGYIVINTGTYSLSSNKSYIWNVQPIYNVINNGAAVLSLPTGPSDGDVITVIDGLQSWGNFMYTGGINISSTDIPITGKISNPNNPYLISVRSARQGDIKFIYNASTNTWQTYTTQNTVNPFNFNPIADKWTGWWSVTNRSNNISPESLFDTQFLPETNNFSATSLSYINIDTTTYPIQIVWLFGSPKNPTTFNSMTTFVHEFLNNDFTTIYNIGSTKGNYFSTTTTMNYGLPYFVKNGPGVFKLQSDNDYAIFTSPGSTGTEGLSFYPCENIQLYKCSTPPPLSQSPDGKTFSYDPTNISFYPGDDPVTLATTMFENLFLHSSPNVNDESSTISTNVIDYNPYTETYNGGFMAAKEIFNQFLNGITFQTSVYAIRKSYSGSSSDYFQGSTELTDIFTNDCSYAYPGSNVVLSGFQNTWSSLNGTYTNGVSAIGDSFLRKTLNPSMCDSTGSQPYNTNMFSLIKDTSSSSYSHNETGAYKNFGTNFGSPTVSVTHRFYSRMPYNEFVAAWLAFMQYVQGPETYSFASNISIQQSSFNKGLVETKWNRLQNSYILPFSSRGFGDAGFISRTYGEISYFIFTGTNTPLFSFNSYPNDPYQIQYAAYNQFYSSFNRINLLYKDDYDNDDTLRLNKQTYIQNNYMTGCKALYIGWIGTGTTGPIENDPKYALSGFAYPLKNQQYNNTFGGSEFTSSLFDLSFTPDYEYWCIQGQAKDFNPQGLDERKYGLIIGQIKPEFSSGTNIGYIRLPHNKCLIDHYNLQEQSIYAPKSLNTGSSKYYREANSKVLSVITQYINSLNCNSVIIDCRYNNGGGIDGKSLAEFFGDDRNGLEYYDGYGGNGYNNLFKISTGSSISTDLTTSLRRLYVRENEANYPNSVFKGATGAQKKVIIISGMGTSGYGSVLYHYFIGDNFDKNIGSDTIVKFIGQMDSRFTGLQPSSRCIDSPPVVTSSKVSTWPYLGYQVEGNSMGCYIQHIPPTSTGPYFSLYGEHPDFLGPDIIIPMSLQETVYPDIGAYTGAFSEAQVNYPNRYLSSVPFTPSLNDYTTWRDTLIEAAIQEAV